MATVVGLFLCQTLWDYVEARQLRQALERWAPGWDRPAARNVKLAPDRDATPYYLAASALARRLSGRFGDIYGTVTALRKGDTTPETVDRATRILAEEVVILQLLDQATERDFQGVVRDADLFGLGGVGGARLLASLRALRAMATGDADAAVRSLVTELKIGGSARSPIDASLAKTWSFAVRQLDDIHVVLSRVEPSAAALDSLSAALTEADDDTRIAALFARGRDRMLAAYLPHLGAHDGRMASPGLFGEGPVNLFDRLLRPLVARDLRWKLEQYAAVIRAAESPWPGRAGSVMTAMAPAHTIRRALGYVGAPLYPGEIGWLDTLPAEGKSHAEDLQSVTASTALIRANRIAVAVERYRRTHMGRLPATLGALAPEYLEAVPVDPYSGGPILFAATEDGYVVYSVGANGQDDRGQELDKPNFTWTSGDGENPRMTGDIGVRIRVSSKK